jgi:hypothetical protein
MPSAPPSKASSSATLRTPYLPSKPSPKSQPQSKHGLNGPKHLATLRAFSDGSLVLALIIPLAYGFRASAILSILPIMEALCPCFPALSTH